MEQENTPQRLEDMPVPDPGLREPGRDWGFLDYLYHVLFQPSLAFTVAAQNKPLWLAAGVVGVALVAGVVGNAGVAGEFFRADGGLFSGVAGSLLFILSLSGVVFGVLVWVILAGVYNLAGELCGGRGNATGLFTTMGLAYLPSVFVSPLQVAGSLLPGGGLLEGFGMFCLGIWSIVLQVLAIRQTLLLSTARAVFVFLLPFILLAGLVAILVAAMVALLPVIDGLNLLPRL
ncbi:MAG: Yip1 family protein [Heliobacteriaceae bacterium]|nr:Yip1 family protein [Heliobacteriaceae bacterium]MDD4587936.1 Yip1 family protein [Heliobacteriaceae bacterium]